MNDWMSCPEPANQRDAWFLSAAGSPTALFTLSAGTLSLRGSRAPADGRADGAGVAVKERDEADGGAALASAEAAPAADPHLLERLLQLRPVRLLPGTHHPGPAMSDWGHSGADHLGLLLPAVLLVGGQLCGGALQEDVSASSYFSTIHSRNVCLLLAC